MKFYNLIKRRTVPALLLCSLVSVAFGQKVDSIDLRLHLKIGDKYTLTSITDAVSSSDIQGKTISFNQKQIANYLVSVDSLLHGGLTRISYKLQSFSFTITSKSMEVHIDSRGLSKCYGSTKTAEDIAASESVHVAQDIGLSFWTDLNENAGVIRSNIDTVYNKKNNSEEMIKGNGKQVIQTVSFAGYPIKINDSWKGIGFLNNEGKAISGKANFTLKSLGKKTAVINSEINDWGDIEDASIIAHYSGVHKIDIVSGLTMETTYKSNMEANQKVNPFKSNSILTVKLTKL